jgi:hypothetical protein
MVRTFVLKVQEYCHGFHTVRDLILSRDKVTQLKVPNKLCLAVGKCVQGLGFRV